MSIVVKRLHSSFGLSAALMDGKEQCALQERLIASCSLNNPKDIKYSLANDAEKRHSLHRLVVRQMHRYWAARSIEDGKSELGMALRYAHGKDWGTFGLACDDMPPVNQLAKVKINHQG